MNTSTAKLSTATQLHRLRTSRRWAWTGPAAAIACMVALFVYGLSGHTPALVVMAASLAAVAAATWSATAASLNRRIAALEASSTGAAA